MWVLDGVTTVWSERPGGELDSEALMECVLLRTRFNGDALNPRWCRVHVCSVMALHIIFGKVGDRALISPVGPHRVGPGECRNNAIQ